MLPKAGKLWTSVQTNWASDGWISKGGGAIWSYLIYQRWLEVTI